MVHSTKKEQKQQHAAWSNKVGKARLMVKHRRNAYDRAVGALFATEEQALWVPLRQEITNAAHLVEEAVKEEKKLQAEEPEYESSEESSEDSSDESYATAQARAYLRYA